MNTHNSSYTDRRLLINYNANNLLRTEPPKISLCKVSYLKTVFVGQVAPHNWEYDKLETVRGGICNLTVFFWTSRWSRVLEMLQDQRVVALTRRAGEKLSYLWSPEDYITQCSITPL